jgi:signal transduction histidine kinase
VIKFIPFLCLLIIYSFFGACNQTPVTAPDKSIIDYNTAKSFYGKNNDSAFYYFNKVVIGSKEKRKVVSAYTYMGIIQHNAGDYFGSQEMLLKSLVFLDEKKQNDYDYLSYNYNELGNNSRSLKRFEDALHYYKLALKFAKTSPFKITNLNNIAVAYQDKNQYDSAISIYSSILNENEEEKLEYARVLSNMTKAKWLKDSNYNAAPELFAALQIRIKENDKWGLNASYGHLTEYYERRQPDAALLYAQKMYTIAQELSSPDDRLFALQKLITLSSPNASKKYFERYQQLNDSLQTARNSAKNQFALIRYETEKHKSQNLILQKENAEKKVRIIEQQVILGGIVILSFAILFWYRRQKQQALREQQLKTSQKVHDVVANGLYRIMVGVEHQPEIDRQQLLDEMDNLYEQSRDISYETIEVPKQSFSNEVAGLLKSFSTEQTSISIVGNTPPVWDKLNNKARTELKRALQELLVNMKKHSAAKNVVVKFDEEENGLKVRYADDGKGIPADFCYGNGLRNTETRIKSIGGQFNFNLPSTTGLNIQIFIPIS